jgi:pimeloyl-ACP methyl ester carboxylesterase
MRLDSRINSSLRIALLALAPSLAWAGLPSPGLISPGLLSPGLYRNDAGHPVYVGIESEAPDAPVNEYFDSSTQHTGDLQTGAHLIQRKSIREETSTLDAPGGALASSLYYAGHGKRATVILIHGNDPETRQMGFIIPYFVLNGINVISYDQRGTGQSSGNWQQSGPMQRARDIEALYDAFATNMHVDGTRLGVWGFSNGGWTAPIVATTRPLAFMILKSGPAETIEANICYTVEQNLQRKHYDPEAITSATKTWRALTGALSGTESWDTARELYAAASTKPWFTASYLSQFIPPGSPIPPAPATAEDLRRFILFDPAETLSKVRTPTLALFGALDRIVDVAYSSAAFKSAFARAGMDDFTIHVYKDAGHTLKVSATGFNNEPSDPERLTAGYPQIMIQWLHHRGFLY